MSDNIRSLPVIIISVVCLLVGAVTGYFITQIVLKSSLSEKALVSPAQRLYDESRSKWGALIKESYVEFSVSGEVVMVKEGEGPSNGTAMNPGKFVTLKSGSNSQTFFLSNFSDWYEGDINQFTTWHKLTELTDQTLKPGDVITIQTHAQIREEANSDSFYSWWVFKQKK